MLEARAANDCGAVISGDNRHLTERQFATVFSSEPANHAHAPFWSVGRLAYLSLVHSPVLPNHPRAHAWRTSSHAALSQSMPSGV